VVERRRHKTLEDAMKRLQHTKTIEISFSSDKDSLSELSSSFPGGLRPSFLQHAFLQLLLFVRTLQNLHAHNSLRTLVTSRAPRLHSRTLQYRLLFTSLRLTISLRHSLDLIWTVILHIFVCFWRISYPSNATLSSFSRSTLLL